MSYDAEHEQGYIKPDDEDDRIPFDRNSLVGFPQGERPADGDRVAFDIEGGMAGLWAINVRKVDR